MTRQDSDFRIAGGFAGLDAPFAVHPNDERRARETIELMVAAGLSQQEMVSLFRAYIADHCRAGAHDRQMARVHERLAEYAV
jgi:hypothetical protein